MSSNFCHRNPQNDGALREPAESASTRRRTPGQKPPRIDGLTWWREDRLSPAPHPKAWAERLGTFCGFLDTPPFFMSRMIRFFLFVFLNFLRVQRSEIVWSSPYYSWSRARVACSSHPCMTYSWICFAASGSSATVLFATPSWATQLRLLVLHLCRQETHLPDPRGSRPAPRLLRISTTRKLRRQGPEQLVPSVRGDRLGYRLCLGRRGCLRGFPVQGPKHVELL